ncbi:MAG: hypothetical protein IT375_17240 [Polyangiaceae bacterium]|nr:hypothetical protein [Polyangiaceae bacterium]
MLAALAAAGCSSSSTLSPKRAPGCKQAACGYVEIGQAGYDSWFGATCCKD